MSLIDLDRPAERPARPPRHWRPWPPTRGVIIALLAGALAGGLVTYRWTAQQRRDADGRTVSVLVFADTRASEIGVLVDPSTGPDRPRRVTFHAAIAVVNAGPRAVRVQGLTAQKAGMTVAGSGRGISIGPRSSSLVDVNVEATCTAWRTGEVTSVAVGGGTVPATVSVETASGAVESVSSLSLDTTGWATQWQGATAKCGESWPRGSGF